MKDYYKILGVTRDSSQDEIKKAYRMLALEFHPDRNNGDKESEERFKEIAESYLILNDAAKKNAYDFANDNRGRYSRENAPTGKATPVTFLMLFRRIKEKVLNAGGYINEAVLFKVIDDLLSEETIAVLIQENDIYTNSLILDEIVVACIFLPYASRVAIHAKLFILADGDVRFINKISVLTDKSDRRIGDRPPAETTDPERPAYFFITFIILLIVLVLVVTGEFNG